MTTIRPSLFPQAPQRPQPQDGGKLDAQRAFFAALTGGPKAAAAPDAPAAAPVAEPAVRTAAKPADPPQKILRPGSLLDIRV